MPLQAFLQYRKGLVYSNTKNPALESFSQNLKKLVDFFLEIMYNLKSPYYVNHKFYVLFVKRIAYIVMIT